MYENFNLIKLKKYHMKKLNFLLILALSFCFNSMQLNAQNVSIPDANFKASLIGNKDINTNGDEEIQESEAVAFEGMINCSGLKIKDLTGIAAFSNITSLYSSSF